MAYNEREVSVNQEQVAAFLADAVRRVEQASVAEVQALNEIKKLFKKNVPFSRRKYVAALLVRQSTGGFRSRYGRDRGDRNDRDRYGRDRGDRAPREDIRRDYSDRGDRFSREDRFSRGDRGEREERPRTPRVQIDPSVASTIFIGIGRNRRVFPRDLLGLLVSVAGLDRERIGEIRVFTNYSFVQLYTEDCEKAISALNGYDYRGRKITVSHSRQKSEGDDAAAEGSAAPRETPPAEEAIPTGVSNAGHAAPESTESDKIAAEQSVFAAQQKTTVSYSAPAPQDEKPYSETTDDGQVKSHFGSGDAY